MATHYHDWGFVDNPFTTRPLKADEQGVRLLIGRDEELKLVSRRLENAPKIPTIEGSIGIGKTSLVNVAAYQLFKRYVDTQMGALIIPCRKAFQLKPAMDAAEFVDEVVREVAQTLIEQSKITETLGVKVAKMPAVNKWLNSPTFTAVQAGLQFVVGVSGGSSTAQNTGDGFQRSGFRKLVFGWLQEIFEENGGGVVCLIDNMELLQQSAAAKEAIEGLRDELLQVTGLRWVLCGANGIIQSLLSSPRLQGVIYAPFEIKGILDKYVPDILTSRVSAFEEFQGDGYLPLTPGAFEQLYEILNRNLRNLLSFADDYCVWVADRNLRPKTDDEKDELFNRWLKEAADSAHSAVGSQLRPRAWEVFDRAVQLGGRFSPSDYELFGCASLPALRPQVKDLEEVGLVQSSRDDTDQRRKSIEVTSKGYLVHYSRRSK